MSGFQAPNPSLFFSRRDPNDPRLGEMASAIQSAHSTDEMLSELNSRRSDDAVVIAGYPDDEGIQINGGRKGAQSGPDAIRKYLYKLTPSLGASAQPKLFDIGNLIINNHPLEHRHNVGREFAQAVMGSGRRWLALGGGHDYGYADTTGFCASLKKTVRPLVINFDAHLDVRPTDRGLSSGTPFYRLLEEFPEIDFLQVGIQSQCNATAHLRWLEQRGGRVVFADQMWTTPNVVMPVLDVAGDWLELNRPTFLSIDLDVFDSSSAPGCSQSWPIGLHPIPFMHLFHELLSRVDVRGVGLYETSPPLDLDDRTSKLAAVIIHRWLYHGK